MSCEDDAGFSKAKGGTFTFKIFKGIFRYRYNLTVMLPNKSKINFQDEFECNRCAFMLLYLGNVLASACLVRAQLGVHLKIKFVQRFIYLFVVFIYSRILFIIMLFVCIHGSIFTQFSYFSLDWQFGVLAWPKYSFWW